MVFRNRIISTTLGAIIGPLLYLVAFGWGIGSAVQVDGQSYTAFVIPGIVALNSMTTAYSWVANDINLSRIYAKTFEAVMVRRSRWPPILLPASAPAPCAACTAPC
ncbi:MAG: hypothetical protein FWH50_00020 [Coriobacteriia bacterium]|nr:hypothetical protein [Coriobacteriia bacterium]